MDKQARSISFSRGKGKLTHTDRTFISPNVDQSRTAQNIVLINQNLSEAYAKIFGEAQANFNVKQKRKDRRIDDYFCKLFGVAADDKTATEVLTNTNKQQSFYEWVVGVGGAYDTGLVDWVNDNGEQVKANPEAAQLAAVCLTEYINGNPEAGVSGYAERNPNFHVMKAIIHMDEKTPHLHIDAVPFADGYKKGMTRQQGIAKALEAMGYGTGETAIAKWQEAERAVFREICERHGFVIRDEEKSRGYTVLTRQYGEFKENELKLEQQQSELDEKKQEIAQALTVRESEERAAKQARQQRVADEQKSANLQAEITELIVRRDNLSEDVEGYEEMLKDIKTLTEKAEAELVKVQEIPTPPKMPFDRKPTPPIAVSREEYIRGSVNSDLGIFEKKKIAKEVGESYDAQISEYQKKLALWEQWERECAEYKDTYGMTEKVQKIAEQQARTAQEQARVSERQKETAAELTYRANALDEKEKTLLAKQRELFFAAQALARQAAGKVTTAFKAMYDRLKRGMEYENNDRRADRQLEDAEKKHRPMLH